MTGGPVVDPARVRPHRAPGQRRQWLALLLVIVLVGVLAAAAYRFLVPRPAPHTLRSYDSATVTRERLVQTAQARGKVVFPVQIHLPSPESGSAALLHVAEGDRVTGGQMLAEISAADLLHSLDDLRADLAAAERSLAKQRLQRRILLQRDRRRSADLDRRAGAATADRDQARALVDRGLAPRRDLVTAQRSLDSVLAERAELQLQLAEDRELAALDDSMAAAAVTGLEVALRRHEARIAALVIASPISGAVLAVEPALTVAGSSVARNQRLFTIADPDSAVIELQVEERHAPALRDGQPVALSVGARAFAGSVIAIGSVARQSADGLGATVLVRVRPEPEAGPLLPGASAVGVLEIGVQESALVLPRGPFLTTGSQRWLYRIEGDRALRVAATFGRIEGNRVEVVSGVAAGDQVIVSGYQNFIEHETVSLGTAQGSAS